MYEQGATVITDMTDDKVTIPENVSSLGMDAYYSLGSAFFDANRSKKITAEITVTDPDGSVIAATGGSINVNANPNFNFCETGWQNCVSSTWDNRSLTVGANQVSGSVSIYVNVYRSGMSMGAQQPLPAGTYTLAVKLLADGQEVAVDSQPNGINRTSYSGRYNVEASSYTVGSDVRAVSLETGLCIDSAQVAVGDVLTPKLFANDTEQVLDDWFVYHYTRSEDAPSPRQQQGMNNGATVTVTQADLDYGLASRVTKYISSPVLGDTYALAASVVDQDGAEVTGDCAPTAADKPTMTLSNSILTISLVSSPKYADNVQCLFYLSSDLTTAVGSSYAWAQMPNTPKSCSLPNPKAGKTYVAKVRGTYQVIEGALSPASDPVSIPAPGYTISPAVSGITDEGGKVSVVSTDVDHYTSVTSSRVTAAPLGGTYRLSVFSSAGACPPQCGPTNSTYILRQTTTTGYVAGFAGTGKVEWDPTGEGSNSASVAWYGAGDKWTISTTDYDATFTAGQLEFIQGSTSSATTTSTIVSQTTINGVCATLGDGWTYKSSANSMGVGVTPISAPTAKQLFLLYCYKPTLMSDNTTTAYLANPLLVTVDNATTISVVKAFGENSATANATTVVFSANPTATGTATALTAFVTKNLVTSLMGFTQTGTVASRDIVRFKADLTSTTTSAGWNPGTTEMAQEPAVIVPQLNDGSFNVILRTSPTTAKLAFVSATGAMSTPVALSNDKAADIANGNWNFPLGVQAGSATDISLIVSNPTSAAVVSVKVATGAGTAGEIVKYTSAGSIGGLSSAYVVDPTSKDIFWWFTDAAAATDKMSVYKWRNPLYVKPTGPVPAVTSKNLEFATDTPAAGTKVTFTGTNLDLVTAVKFGTVTATLGAKSATSLEVTVPAGTGTVAISLESANGNGDGGSFKYVGATKVAQTVTLNSGAAAATVGDADRTLSATVSMTGYTATPSLTYSTTTSAVCSVTGTKLKFLTKGSCVVKATQAGSSWAAEGSATATITVDGPDAQTISVRTVQVGEKQINPDGFFIYPSASSGLAVSLTFNTPAVCKKGTYSAFHVINVKTGSCKITIVQAGDSEWATASQLVTYTVTAAGSKKITDLGNAGAPVALASSGVKKAILSEVVAWKKSTGALTISSKGVWIGPITASAVFKIGTKTYTCSVKYGTLKAVSSKLATTQKSFAPTTAFCASSKSTDKAALAALKKVTTPLTVKIVVWRDLRNPVKFTTKGTQIERSIYVTIGG